MAKKEILESLPTSELDAMLNAELRKEVPDEDLVRTILSLLEERGKDQPVEITSEIQAAWDKFNAKEYRRADWHKPTARSWVIRITSIAAVLCLLICVIPMEAQAESWWEKIARWTSEVFEIFTAKDAEFDHSEYVFKTDNPGLQQVYDAVVELGITEPVVPMWIPEGYKLIETKTTQLSNKIRVGVNFSNEKNDLIFKIDVLKLNNWHEYPKSDEDVSEYEYAGIKHLIMRNNNRWKVVWGKEKIECFISFVGEEEYVYKIIRSIYCKEV